MVLSYRRRAIVDAFAAVCAEFGYSTVTINHVVKQAKSSRNSVYAQFENKEAILLELLRQSVEEIFERVERACDEGGADWWQRADAALEATLAWVAEKPDAARALLFEFEAAGPEAAAIARGMIDRFTELLREVLPTAPDRPAAIDPMVVGGIVSIARGRVLAGEPEAVPGLAPELLTFLKTPYVLD